MDDEPIGGIGTDLSVEVGGSTTGNIEAEGDVDYFAVELQAGVTYQIDLEGVNTGVGTLVDPLLLGIFNASGEQVAASDDDGGSATNSRIVFTPSESGTYFIAASHFDNENMDDIGIYKVYVAEEALSDRPDGVSVSFVELSGNDHIDSLTANFGYQADLDGTTRLTYSIPDANSTFFNAFELEEIDLTQSFFAGSNATVSAFTDGLSFVEALANIEFTEVEDAGNSFGVLRIAASDAESGNVIGIAGFPSRFPEGSDIFIFENQISGQGYLQSVVLHELGHALGLRHFTDGRTPMPEGFGGAEFSQMAPSFASAFFSDAVIADLHPTTFGYLDILALTHIYGANNFAFGGNDTYTFDTSSRYWQTIYDLGGTDTILITGSGSVDIDLTADSSALGGRFIDVGTTVNYLGSIGQTVGTRTATVFITPETVIENITASSGDDRIVGNDVANRISGGGGQDLLIGGAGADTIKGGDGDDAVSAGDGNDVLFAGVGDTGDDFSAGDAGNDLLGGGAGNDFLVGGGHNNTVSGLEDAGSSPSLDGQDTLFGGTGDDTLLGGGFNDQDGDGNYDDGEAVENGLAPNAIYGGPGDDRAHGAAGDDTIGGGDGNDTLVGGDGADVFYGGRNDQNVVGVNDKISGGAGNDTIFASVGDDIVAGGTGGDIIFGGAGNDTITGGDGSDAIFNGAGNDIVDAGSGADTIRGSPGDDTLFGGSGADLFSFRSGDGDDVINDFVVGVDQLNLSRSSTEFGSADDVSTAAVQTTVAGQDGVLIDLGAGDSIFLVGLSLVDIERLDFIF